MAFIRAIPGGKDNAYDERNNLLVVPVGQSSALHMIDTSSGGTVLAIDDESIASLAERNDSANQAKNKQLTDNDRRHPIFRLNIKGLRAGRTTLRAKRIVGSDGMTPLTIQVVTDPAARQSGNRGAITPEFRAELQSLTLREAVLRVAEDQMNSKLGRNAGGFGEYADKSYDWCGAFCYYCWKVACAAKGESNPFGESVASLLSCQKAVSWAMQTQSCRILRYQGGDPYGGAFNTTVSLGKPTKTQEFIDISPANPVEPGDIAILRKPSGEWQHVCMVWETPTGETLETIDGNQDNPCIARRTRSMTARVNQGRDFALIFLHVRGVN
jgi:hypothetical protein